MSENFGKKVAVAMSGGVDSSIAAALLVESGFDVTGITLKLSPCEIGDDVEFCCGRGALTVAAKIAKDLGIRHYFFDCEKEFKKEVLMPSWSEYCAGRTPSPCSICNREIKFGLLMEKAAKLGISTIATGHYARVVKNLKTGESNLLRGIDKIKDQSYFLFSIPGNKLSKLVFPLGEMTKTDVRKLANAKGLANAKRPESQDACLQSLEGGFGEGLRCLFNDEEKTGKIKLMDGTEVGNHKGIHHFTIGQRKGLGVSFGHRAYVVKIDAETRDIWISTNIEDLMRSKLTAINPNWLTGNIPKMRKINCQAQIRYNSPPAEATFFIDDDNTVKVEFAKPQKAVSPGQTVVFYDDDRVLGGAWIA